jgi:hypothetical protein
VNSPEYPDLPWVTPRSWTNANRSSVQLIVIHTTEGHENVTSAEDGAAYDARRTDGTSTHFFHDANSTVQCVRTNDIAHAARSQGNKRGIQYELCGRAGQGAAGWADAASQGTLRQAARQCARDARKWDIPVRHLTVAQVAAGAKGFCGHVDISRAFPQDGGDHTDPGPTFPWSAFLDMVRDEIEELENPMSAKDVEQGVATFFWNAVHAARGDKDYQDADAETKQAWRNARDTVRELIGGPVDLKATNAMLASVLDLAKNEAAEVPPSVDQIVSAVKAAAGAGDVATKAALLRAIMGPEEARAVGKILAA